MPEVGDIARTVDLGLTGLGRRKVIWHACLGCGATRWVVLRNGAPQSARCPQCGPAHANKLRTREVGADGLLECGRCRQRKPLADFTRRKDTAARVGSCRACQTERSRRWRAANPERNRDNRRAYERRRPEVSRASYIKSRYGITAAEYDAMLVRQGGGCAICREQIDGSLDIDHCHTTGRVRGLLCGPCNRMLGLAKDRPEVLSAAARYLDEQLIDHLGEGDPRTPEHGVGT